MEKLKKRSIWKTADEFRVKFEETFANWWENFQTIQFWGKILNIIFEKIEAEENFWVVCSCFQFLGAGSVLSVKKEQKWEL